MSATILPVSTDLTVGTRAVVVITETGKRFATAVTYVKRLGGQFDAAGKVWLVNITEGNVEAVQKLVSPHGNFTGFQVIGQAAWDARRK